MRLLLDTHIWVWSLIEPSRLSHRVWKELDNPANELWLSPITLWELIVLCEKGRMKLEPDVDSWIGHKLKAVPLQQAPVTHDVAREVGRLELDHRDPADRFLVATAKVFELTLVTADERLMKVREVPVLANRQGD